MSKLTVNECKQIILKGRKQLTNAEQRISDLEPLLRDVWAAYSEMADASFHPAWEVDSRLDERMAALGLAVER